MILAWVAGALGADGEALARIHAVEWARGDVLALAGEAAGADDAARAAAMIAAGRMRTADALPLLDGGRTDPALAVRVAAAEALGWTPGGAPKIREWLATEPLPTGLAGRAAAERGVLVALIEALGFQAEVQDLPLLVGYLAEPWPVGDAAARALGRMGVRKVAGVDQAVGELAGRLDAVDPRVGTNVAWALARIGMKDAAPLAVERVVARLRARDSYAETRARLVRAVWPRLDAETRSSLFVPLATDPSNLVRVALFTALEPEDAAPEVLAAFLADRDPWIRQVVIDAIGREGSPAGAALLAEHRTADLYERAAIVRARNLVDPAAAVNVELPAVIRAAYAGALTDRTVLEQLAASADEAMVRTTAVQVLVDDPGVPSAVGVRLLAASDPGIREAAIEIVARAPREARIAALVARLGQEKDRDVAVALARAVVDAKGKRAQIEPILGPLAADRRTEHAADLLAQAVGLPRPAIAPPKAPTLLDPATTRRAVVETSEGTFTIALDPDVAPIAVDNFAQLANQGFYDGLVFHRVVPGFVVQAGCPRGDGWGGPGYTIPDEVSALPFARGAVGMARADRDTGGSQWFVTTSDQPHLTGEYTRFGDVVQGLHVVERIHPGTQVLKVTIVGLDGRAMARRATPRGPDAR